jgi:hypothetical protein
LVAGRGSECRPRVGGFPGIVRAGMAWSGCCGQGTEPGEDLSEQVVPGW